MEQILKFLEQVGGFMIGIGIVLLVCFTSAGLIFLFWIALREIVRLTGSIRTRWQRRRQRHAATPTPTGNQAGGSTTARQAAAPAATPVMPPPPSAPTPTPIRRVAPPAAPTAGATATTGPQPLSEKYWFRFFTAVVFGLTCVWFLRELLQAVHEKATGPGLLAFLFSFWAFRLAYFGGTGMLKFSTIHKILVWWLSLLMLGIWWAT